MQKDYIDVFTDGSLVRHGRLVRCGYGIYFPNGEYKSISRNFNHEPITNNRAELYAILKSIILCHKIQQNRLQQLENKSDFETENIEIIKKVNIYSDSEYSVKTFNVWLKGWKKSGKEYLNKDIIDEIDEHIQNAPFEVSIIHVPAHTNKKDYYSANNNKAEHLAKEGAYRLDKKN
jgi:ribonuclease HI